MDTITITFCEQAENHVGMQKIGSIAKDGFQYEELLSAQKRFKDLGFDCEMIELSANCNNKAHVLIIREGVKAFVNAAQLYTELKNLTPDKKAFMYGRVVNKINRYNLCFSDIAQEPDYANKKGTIIAFSNVHILSQIRDKLPIFFGEKANKMKAEGNYYYDVTKCGIHYHGDSERKRVIALRLGKPLPLRYKWFLDNTEYGKDTTIILNHADMYVMSEKATGYDWKKRSILTLRHAAGSEKYINPIKKKKKQN